MTEPASTCLWCGAEAVLLCDAMIGTNRRHDGTVIMDEMFTCDAPTCRACGKQVGHICGEDPDSIDMCPEHAARRPRVSDLAVGEPATDAIRHAIRVKAWRSRMRVLSGGVP